MWKKYLKKAKDNGRRVVLWGGGSKGVTFLNMKGDRDKIEYVIDTNPRKHGKYIPGTGQKIVIDDLGLSAQLMLVL